MKIRRVFVYVILLFSIFGLARVASPAKMVYFYFEPVLAWFPVWS